MKEQPSMRSPLESMTIMTAGIDDLNRVARQITAKTQQDYFTDLRRKYGHSYQDHFSTSKFYRLLSERMPGYIPEETNRVALNKFKARDPKYGDLFIMLNMNTITSAARKYFTDEPEHDDDLIQNIIEKFHGPDFSPPAGKTLKSLIHAYTTSTAKQLTKKDITESIEEKEFIPDSTVIPMTEQVAGPKIEEEMLCEQLDSAVSELKPRQQTILKLKYSEGKNLKEIGDIIGVSRERVRVILVRTIASMRYKTVLERYPLIKEYRDKSRRRQFC